jgi:hypothetical protein
VREACYPVQKRLGNKGNNKPHHPSELLGLVFPEIFEGLTDSAPLPWWRESSVGGWS